MRRSSFVLALMAMVAALPLFAAATGDLQGIPISSSSGEAVQLVEKAQKLVDVGRPMEARDLLQQALSKDPGFAFAQFTMATVALSPEEFKKDLDLASKNSQGQSDAVKLLIQINQTFLDNNAQKRLELCNQLVQKYPDSPRAWLNLGFAQGTLNQFVDSRKSFSKALELDPKFEGAHYALAFSYVFNDPKDPAQAVKHFQMCIQLNPAEAKAYEGLGDSYRGLNQLEKARDAYTQSIAKDPKLVPPQLKKGHINSFLGNYDDARADYDKAVAGAEPVNKLNYALFKCLSYVYAGQSKEAVNKMQQLVDSADSSGLPQDQINTLKLAILNTQIIVALHANLLPEAEKTLAQIKTLTEKTNQQVNDPNFARIANAANLLLEGQLAARKKDYTSALQKAEENRKMVEVDQNPRKLEGYYQLLGLVALLQGKYSDAVTNYQKADLTNMYVKYHLALAYDGVGQKDKAKAIYMEVAHFNFNTVGYALTRMDALAKSA